MPTLNYSVSISGLGGAISRNTPRTADGGGAREITVPKGFAGTLSTRTDNETGTLTLGNGHGITTGQIIDLYWNGGARYEITVGTVSGNSVPIGADDSGSGSNLPIATTAIVASPRVAFNADIDGDELSLLAIQQVYANTAETAKSRVSLLDSADDEIAALTLDANTPRVFDVEGGDSNPFTGDPITNGVVSNGSSAADATLRILWVSDATP
jgi:hypothetical protein